MNGDVAVVDPLPMFRYGVAAVLAAAGYHVATPADVVEWAGQRDGCLVLLSLTAPADWRLLTDLAVRPECAVIALVGGDQVENGMRALRAGARSVVPRVVSAETLRRTLAATADGQAVLPAAVSSALVSGTIPAVGATALSLEQVSWLRHLAAGCTVARLADRAGYSERAMFRLLRSLYRRMGVRTRTEAIVRACELGLLGAGQPGG